MLVPVLHVPLGVSHRPVRQVSRMDTLAVQCRIYIASPDLSHVLPLQPGPLLPKSHTHLAHWPEQRVEAPSEPPQPQPVRFTRVRES